MLLGVLTFTAKLCENPVRCHEARQHWSDQPDWIANALTTFVRQEFGIREKVSMYGGRQLMRDLDRFVIGECTQFEFCQVSCPYRVQVRDRD